ncbi:hypothetical protein LCGC14_0303410 [marine sediment metagenome]|uniref:Uncharacterized protein n=1 Tax=marine sediment metagenome TaxID=412755 RepID=A0A0F9TPS9_9ZZZZ
MSRDYRRTDRNHNRTLAIKGSGEKKHGVGRKSAKIAEDTRRFKQRRSRVQGGPVALTLPRTRLKEELNEDGVRIELDRTTSIRTPRMRISSGKIPSEFQKRGIVVENFRSESFFDIELGDQVWGSTFTLSTFDTLYAYQLGLLGTPVTRKSSFKGVMNWAIVNDPDFMEKYMVYMALRDANFIVVDGYQYGVTFAFIEPLPKGVRDGIKTASPEKIGPQRDIALISGGLVDVVPEQDDMRINELIKGQHLATKNDLRYYTATANGQRDEDGHIKVPGEGITVALLKRDRLSIPFAGDNVETLIFNSPSAFEFEGDIE